MAALVVLGFAFSGSVLLAATSERPNIILIMADDLGYSDIGCYGSEIRTPNLDALAARGVRFTQFYNGAVCCPSRAALLTGLYAHQAGVGWMVNHGEDSRPPGPYQGYLNDRCVTLAEVLKSAGYRTLMSGKWHVGESRGHWPLDRGFDRYFGLISGAANYFDLTKTVKKGVVRRMLNDDQPYHPPKEGFYMTDAIAENAVQFIAAEAGKPQPFFLYVAFTAPHTPLHAPPEDVARYQGKYRQGWDAVRAARHARMKQLGVVGPEVKLTPRHPGVPAWESIAEKDLMDLQMAIYAAQVTRMDDGIGRILATLHQTGREQNTLVIFLADNGGSGSENISDRAPHLNRPPFLGGPESYESYGRRWGNVSNAPWRDLKTSLYEGGISTPFIAAWPGVIAQPGGFARAPAHLIDCMATFVEISGATYPRRWRGHEIHPMEGVSFLPSLRGQSQPERPPLYWELEGRRAMRHGRWKLTGSEGASWQLYDIASDRSELRDLAAAEPERVRAMGSLYEVWARRAGVGSWQELSQHLSNLPGGPKGK